MPACIIRAGSFHACLYYLPASPEQASSVPACIARAVSFLACLYCQSRQLPCLPVLSEQAASLPDCIVRAGSFLACIISVCLKRIHYKIRLNIRYQKEGHSHINIHEQMKKMLTLIFVTML